MSDWYWTTNEENWVDGPHDSREAAAVEATAEVPGCTFWTGRRKQVEVSQFTLNADHALEQVGEQAYEIAGEWAEAWPDGQAALPELQAALDLVIQGWLEKHSPPSFWVAADVQEHDGDRS